MPIYTIRATETDIQAATFRKFEAADKTAALAIHATVRAALPVGIQVTTYVNGIACKLRENGSTGPDFSVRASPTSNRYSRKQVGEWLVSAVDAAVSP